MFLFDIIMTIHNKVNNYQRENVNAHFNILEFEIPKNLLTFHL